MSITDELREIAAKTERASGRCEKLYRGDLDHAADRIDERIEREYAKMPVGADGVPIRVGDEVENFDCPEQDYAKFVVGGYTSEFPNGKGALMVVSDDDESHWYASDLRHVRPDSWERILDDAAKLSRGDNGAVMELVERCRRLAGEGE